VVNDVKREIDESALDRATEEIFAFFAWWALMRSQICRHIFPRKADSKTFPFPLLIECNHFSFPETP